MSVQATLGDGRVDAMHELGDVERKLRESTTEDVEVHVGDLGRSARIWFDTSELNPALRGDLVAGVCREITTSDAWRLSRVHDPLEREDGIVQAAISVVLEDGDRDG